MSLKKIIVEVKAHPELWDPSHRHYRSRMARSRAWKLISKEIGKDVGSLKKHWKNLKDAFRKELKRIVSKEIVSSNWQHYDDLTFITEEIKLGRGVRIKLHQNESDSDEQQPLVKKLKNELDPLEFQEPKQTPCDSIIVNSKSVDNEAILTGGKKINLILYRLNKVKKLIQTENKTREDGLGKDADYLYLISLLPTIRKLSDIQKLYLRGKINEWLIEAVTETEFINKYDNKINMQIENN